VQMKQDGRSSKPQPGSTTPSGRNPDPVLDAMVRYGMRLSKKNYLEMAGLDHLSPQELEAWEAESGRLPAEWDSLPED
jgi:hypothetical protein